jgi:subtilisin family serine protease
MSRTSLVVSAAVPIIIGLLSSGGAAQGRSSARATFVESDVLVQFRGDATFESRGNARGRVGGVRQDLVLAANRRNDGKGDLEVMHIPPGLAVSAAVRELALDSSVEFAEPNWTYQHENSNDPYYTNGSLWGMYGDASTPANPFGSQAGEAWKAGHIGSANVYVGIIDEGVMGTHPDLAGNMWKNPVEVANGIDDDHNGYVDDLTGWDFSANNNSTFDGNGDDHGTHVAGTIGAIGNNNAGVAGVNWDVTMIPAKFLGARGGTTADAIKAIDYLVDLKTRHGLNLVATNNSWGGGGFSQALLDAINRGGAANILFIAAAGNGGSDGVGDDNDSVANYPSNYQCAATPPGGQTYDCLIAVAAITSTGARASFSNFGLKSVDIGAPGAAVYSTVPAKGNKASYASYSGTSMATPHVTGAAALYASTHAGATAAQIKAAILGSAVPTPALNGKTVTGGRLNVSGF